jgi:KaiC/GvpD/RAD55 family RecA-like ATPase
MSSDEIAKQIAQYVASGLRVIRNYTTVSPGVCSCWQGADCANTGKHTTGKTWQTTVDEDEVFEWWGSDAVFNVGVMLGPTWPGNGPAVIDIEADDDEGAASLARLGMDKFPTPTWSSGRGLHRLFLWQPELPDVQTKKVSGIEFRIGGNKAQTQSILPPSVHHSGRQYAWLPGFGLDEVDIAPVPPQLLELLTERKAQAPAMPCVPRPLWRGAREFLESGKLYPNKGRRDTCLSVSCDLARCGWKLEDATKAVMAQAAKLGLKKNELADIPRHVKNGFDLALRDAAADSAAVPPAAPKIAATPAITMEPIPGGSRAVMTACNSETGEVVDIDAIDLAKAKDRYTYSVRIGAKFEGVDLAAIDKQLLDMAGQRVSGDKPAEPRPARSLVDIIDAWRKRECKPRVATGFQWFDGPTKGGLPVGGMVGLFAPPKSFKSALALQLVMGAMHTDPDLRVVWARGEMTEEDFADRCTAIGSGIIADCEMVTVEDCEKRTPAAVRAAMRVVEEFYDRITWVPPKLTAADIEAEVVRTGAKVCVVDYLQKVSLPGGGKDRVNDIDTIVEQVREMTERLGLATILISSMAKPTSGTGSHLGQLGRGSVDIGHAVEIGYEAVIKRNDEGDPIEDADGFIPVRWRCAGARSIKAVDLRLRFDGPQMTHEDADGVMPFRELGDGAFTVGAPR